MVTKENQLHNRGRKKSPSLGEDICNPQITRKTKQSHLFQISKKSWRDSIARRNKLLRWKKSEQMPISDMVRNSEVIKEINILITVRYHIIPIQVTKQLNQIIPRIGEETGRQALLDMMGV